MVRCNGHQASGGRGAAYFGVLLYLGCCFFNLVSQAGEQGEGWDVQRHHPAAITSQKCHWVFQSCLYNGYERPVQLPILEITGKTQAFASQICRPLLVHQCSKTKVSGKCCPMDVWCSLLPTNCPTGEPSNHSTHTVMPGQASSELPDGHGSVWLHHILGKKVVVCLSNPSSFFKCCSQSTHL